MKRAGTARHSSAFGNACTCQFRPRSKTSGLTQPTLPCRSGIRPLLTGRKFLYAQQMRSSRKFRINSANILALLKYALCVKQYSKTGRICKLVCCAFALFQNNFYLLPTSAAFFIFFAAATGAKVIAPYFGLCLGGFYRATRHIRRCLGVITVG